MRIEITPISESALVCRLNAPSELGKQQKLWEFAAALEQHDRIEEVVVGMNNLTVFTRFDTDLATLADELQYVWEHTAVTDHQGKLVEIPVCYGGEYGPDLAEVAAFHQTDISEIVRRHTAQTYTVFMMGFQPGFPYLGGLPEALHTPRRAVPNLRSRGFGRYRRQSDRCVSVRFARRLADYRQNRITLVPSRFESADPAGGGRPSPLCCRKD